MFTKIKEIEDRFDHLEDEQARPEIVQDQEKYRKFSKEHSQLAPIINTYREYILIQEELETRKMVERAKEILMQRRNLSGEEAYRWIQKQSMDSRKPIRHIAEAILLSEELYQK